MRLQKHLPSLIVYVFRLLKESIENVVTMQRKGKSIPVKRSHCWNTLALQQCGLTHMAADLAVKSSKGLPQHF